MKLDKIKFASLIGYITEQIHASRSLSSVVIERLDELIDINVEPISMPLNLNAIDGLMATMAQGTQKIEAIKYHRALTDMGLKDSKDAVEKYWIARSD